MTANATNHWPASRSEMGDRMRHFDWASTPLGPAEHWPQALRHLLDTLLDAPLPMCILWGDTAVQLYNDAHARLLGDLHPGALGRPVRETWGDGWAAARSAWLAARRGTSRVLTDQCLELNYRGVTRQIWLELAMSPLRTLPTPGCVLLCVRESTEQMLNEARLHETAFHYKVMADNHRLSEQRLQLALEASDLLGIWDWDLHEQDYATAPSFFSLAPHKLGCDNGLTLKGFLEHVHPGDRARIQAAIRHCVEHSGAFAERYRIATTNGELRWAFARGRCHYDDHGTPLRFPGAIMDITRQQASEEALRQSEAELRELNETLESRIQERTSALAEVYERLLAEMAKREQAQEALRQAQKMEAVGQLTGGIAHDFNNMLTGIISGLDLIQHYIRNGRAGDTQRFIEAATTSANRAAALTHRLLAFSRRQPLDLKRVDLNSLIHSMQELFIRTLGPHIRIQTQLQATPCAVNSDENQLESALLNLVINARDAMPDGGLLRIASRNMPLPSDCMVGDLPAGPYVVLSVSDSGCGMSPKVLASAFEPFFTTKPIGQGTGLGLSMIYGFVRQSGGHVQLTSEPGAGTEVSLYLPAHLGADEDVPDIPVPTLAAPRRAGGSILVVEDDPAVRLLVVEVLGDLGYRVLEATEARAALSLLESGADIDLLVTDVGLPGMNGRQLADLVREHHPDLRILFMTGYAAQAASSGFLEPGMALISKPFSIDTLIRHVQQALQA